MGSSSVLARAGAGSSFEVSFIDEIGVRRREPLPLCWNLPFERAAPSRLLDFDSEIVAFSSQPFLLIWPGHQRGECTHTPDFFARRADGTGVVIDVRPDSLIDPKAAKVFDVTASACAKVGWEFSSHRRALCRPGS
jgi:hypothetical protein